MIQNEWHSWHAPARRSYQQPYRAESLPPRPPVQEDTLKEGVIHIERKTFIFALKENVRGRFLRISEDSGARRNTIIVPATGLEDFRRVINEMVNACNDTPLKQEPPTTTEE